MLARVISGSDEVTLTARGITVLVELLQSDQSTTVVITGKFKSKWYLSILLFQCICQINSSLCEQERLLSKPLPKLTDPKPLNGNICIYIKKKIISLFLVLLQHNYLLAWFTQEQVLLMRSWPWVLQSIFLLIWTRRMKRLIVSNKLIHCFPVNTNECLKQYILYPWWLLKLLFLPTF